jgi:hypothetical protein
MINQDSADSFEYMANLQSAPCHFPSIPPHPLDVFDRRIYVTRGSYPYPHVVSDASEVHSAVTIILGSKARLDSIPNRRIVDATCFIKNRAC